MLRNRQVFRDKALTISVVESVESWHDQSSSRCQVIGKIEPLAVVVSGPDGDYALDVNAQPIDPDHLSQMLARVRPARNDIA